MWGKYSYLSARLDEMERRMDEQSKIINESMEPDRNISQEDIGAIVMDQIVSNKHIQDIKNKLGKHHACCPHCKGKSFLQYILRVGRNSLGEWQFVIGNKGYIVGGDPYKGYVDVEPLKDIYRWKKWDDIFPVECPLYRCICGHEWLELRKGDYEVEK